MNCQNIIDDLVSATKEIIGENLTGIYLHGSLAMGCFNSEKSDIDFIIIIKETISDARKTEWLNRIVALNQQAPAKGLEISIVKRNYCNPFVYPTPFELHFSPMHLQWFLDNPQDYVTNMKGTDIDLAAHFTMLHHCGIVLYGEKIETVFADVPVENYIDSICSDIEAAREDILEQPIYIILNLCRVLAFLKDNLYLSKKEGGEWGIRHLPPEYHPLIQDALDCYATDKNMKFHRETAVSFAENMLRLIEESR